MNSNKFQDAQNKLIIQATRVAGNYLLSHYGSTHLIGEPKVELTSVTNPVTSALEFSGKITCFATPGLLNQVGINMTVNSNDIEVESETIQADITEALNAAAEHTDTVVASLDGFKLNDNGTMYLKVSHSDLQDANLGIVGKNEYATSPNKSELLQSIVKDAMLETPISFTGEFKEPVITKKASGCDQCDATMINGKFCHEHGCINSKPKKDDEFYDEYLLESSQKKASLNVKANSMQDEAKAHKAKNPNHKVIPGIKSWICDTCNAFNSLSDEDTIKSLSQNEASLKTKVSSWLTAELLTESSIEIDAHSDAACPGCGKLSNDKEEFAGGAYCDNCLTKHMEKNASVIIIKEDMPMSKSADHLAQSAQLEEQSSLAAQAKVEHEAANALMALLQGMGYGSAKIVESSRSNDGLDFMAAIDDAGSVKAVSIPVTIKEAKVILPKKSLISTLISKGLDVKAKLTEQFDLEALEKLAAIEENIAYEANEVVSILNENLTVEKIAAGEKQPFFDSDDSTMTVQKHLLPNHEDYKVGDKLSDGTDEYEIVNTDGQQNDKNEGSSSQWTLKKCQAPERGDKEPKNTIPS